MPQTYNFLGKTFTDEDVYKTDTGQEYKRILENSQRQLATTDPNSRTYANLQTNIKYYSPGGVGFEDTLRDYQLKIAGEVGKGLGLTASQLYANPQLATDPQALAKYTGGSYGGTSYAPGTPAWAAGQAPQAPIPGAANQPPPLPQQQPMSFQQIQQSILQTAQQYPELIGYFKKAFPDLSEQFEEGFNAAKDAGTTAPTDATGANEMLNQFLGDQIGTSAIQDFVSNDPYLKATLTAFQQYMDNQNQRLSLVDTYKQMLEDTGIEQMDTDLLNMKNIIEGTEDDIRTEVTKAGGFATDSQVIALSNARNKQLIKNYNTLLETRNSKASYLNTMMGLTADDRAEADRLFETQMNFGMKIAELNQQMKQNAISTIDRVAKTLGWDGVYQAAQGNPQVIAQIERTYGLPAGSLAIAAQRDADIRATQQQQQALDTEYQQAQIDKLKQPDETSLGTITDASGNKIATLYDNKTGKTRQVNLGKEPIKKTTDTTDIEIIPFDQFVDEYMASPKGQELIKKIERERQQSLTITAQRKAVADTIRGLYDQVVSEYGQEEFTSTEKKKLEQAGLKDADRQKQLDYLYGKKDTGGGETGGMTDEEFLNFLRQ